MAALLPFAVAAGGQVLSSMMSGGLQYAGTKETNIANARQADKQMRFQERMSSTAYQRTVEDMKKAGINPMLAATVGGASTPVGASAKMENELGSASASARQAFMEIEQIRNLREMNKNLQATNVKTQAETDYINKQSQLKETELPRADFFSRLWKSLLPSSEPHSAKTKSAESVSPLHPSKVGSDARKVSDSIPFSFSKFAPLVGSPFRR